MTRKQSQVSTVERLGARLAQRIKSQLHQRRPYLADWEKLRNLRFGQEPVEEALSAFKRTVFRCPDCGTQFFQSRACCGKGGAGVTPAD